MKREKEFYKKRGIPWPKANLDPDSKDPSNNVYKHTSISSADGTDGPTATNGDTSSGGCDPEEPVTTKTPTSSTSGSGSGTNDANGDKSCTDYHRSDEQVIILLENHPGSNMKPVKRKFIQCSAHTTITHIKKFVSKKLYDHDGKHKEVSVILSPLPVTLTMVTV